MAAADRMRRAVDALARALALPAEGGPSLGRVFVAALVVLFAFEAVTGLLLALTYVPSPTDAWASVFFLDRVVTGGWMLRGLHHFAAQALLVVLACHLVAVAAAGAYRGAGRGGWWAALGLLVMLLGLLITGHRLPWDQNTYWALQVELNLAGAVPVIGPPLRRLVLGGADAGKLTLTRLYALHALFLPLAAWWLLRRVRSGVAPEGARRLPAWVAPTIVWIALLVVAGVTVATGGPALGAPAEPDRAFPARPEWFILHLYALRSLVPPSLEIAAITVVPGLGFALLVALPWIDREGERARRVPALAGAGAMLLAVVALTGVAAAKEPDEDTKEAFAEADRRRARALELADDGIPPGGPLAMLANDPLTRGRDVYHQYCTGCHVLDGEGERKAADHTGFASRAWIVALLHDPDAPHFFGETGIDDMPSQSDKGADALRDAAAFLFSLGVQEGEEAPPAERVARGRTLWEGKCMTCHLFEGDGDFLGLGGPDLTGYASVEWIRTQTARPETHYGELDEMPAFEDQLRPHDVDMVARYLRLQRFEEPVFPERPDDDEDGR